MIVRALWLDGPATLPTRQKPANAPGTQPPSQKPATAPKQTGGGNASISYPQNPMAEPKSHWPRPSHLGVETRVSPSRNQEIQGFQPDRKQPTFNGFCGRLAPRRRARSGRSRTGASTATGQRFDVFNCFSSLVDNYGHFDLLNRF